MDDWPEMYGGVETKGNPWVESPDLSPEEIRNRQVQYQAAVMGALYAGRTRAAKRRVPLAKES